MITLVRVDDRLIHGQVAVTWTSYLSADTIVVANDKHAKDAFLQMALNLAKPPGVDLQILTKEDSIRFCNDPSNNGKKIFIVVESTADALILSKGVAGIKDVILGGIRAAAGRKRVERQVFLNQEDFDNCAEMTALGKVVNVQQIPSENKLTMDEARKKYDK